MPSQQLQSLIAMVRARPVAPDATVQELREHFEMASELFPLPPDVAVQVTNAGSVMAEWIDIPGADPSAVLLYLHGGGYVIGSLSTGRVRHHEGGRRSHADGE